MGLTCRVVRAVVFAAVLAGASVQAVSPQLRLYGNEAEPQHQQQQQQQPPTPNLTVGDRVEAWITAEWLPATLVRIGGGPWAHSPYLVEYGKPIGGIQPIRWLSADQVRPLTRPEPPPPPPPAVRVGDMVEAYINIEWMPARLVKVGGGPFDDSPYLVEYGTPIRGIQPIRWLSADYIRPRSPAAPVQPAAGPRLGRYQMLSYGNPSNPIRIGHIMLLAGEKYEFYSPGGELLGTGRWVFIASEQEVVWHSGLLQEQGWGGSFEVRREGKTHQITLMRGTIATNSID